MYRSLKSEFLQYFSVQDWTMHFTLGLAFFAVAFAITRLPWFSFWLLVAMQLGNEGVDIIEQSHRFIDYRQSVADTLWTIAAPAAAASVLATIRAVWQLMHRT